MEQEISPRTKTFSVGAALFLFQILPAAFKSAATVIDNMCQKCVPLKSRAAHKEAGERKQKACEGSRKVVNTKSEPVDPEENRSTSQCECEVFTPRA